MKKIKHNPRVNLQAIPLGTPLDIARARIKQITETGKARAAAVIQYVQNLKPVDRVVRADKLYFVSDSSMEPFTIFVGKHPGQTAEGKPYKGFYEAMHINGLHQATDRVGIPWSYVDRIRVLKDDKLRKDDHWGPRLLAENLDVLYNHSDKKVLLRSIEGRVRAVLSNSFKRLDSGPLIEAFAEVVQEVGAIPYEGYVSDTKIGLQAIIPKIYEPIKDEIMAYGVSFENSDFGNGALNVAVFLLRLQSMAGMIGPDKLRRVHLGKRLDEETFWSDETSKLDIATVCSGVKDLVRNSLSPERIEAMQLLIYEASLALLGEDGGKLSLTELQKYLTKSELDRAMAKFNEADIVTLPPGNTVWRMSNAVAWLAGEEKDNERKLELQKAAGKLLVTPVRKAS